MHGCSFPVPFDLNRPHRFSIKFLPITRCTTTCCTYFCIPCAIINFNKVFASVQKNFVLVFRLYFLRSDAAVMGWFSRVFIEEAGRHGSRAIQFFSCTLLHRLLITKWVLMNDVRHVEIVIEKLALDLLSWRITTNREGQGHLLSSDIHAGTSIKHVQQ